MFNRLRSNSRQVQLSGDVAFLHFTIDYEDSPHNQELWSYIAEVHTKMEAEMDNEVKEILGSGLQIRQVFYRTGSLEMLVILGTAYTIFSTYIDFSDSLNRLVSQIRSFLDRFFRQRIPLGGRPSVSGSWSPGPPLLPVQRTAPARLPLDGAAAVPIFIIGAHVITHLALVGMFLWMIISRL